MGVRLSPNTPNNCPGALVLSRSRTVRSAALAEMPDNWTATGVEPPYELQECPIHETRPIHPHRLHHERGLYVQKGRVPLGAFPFRCALSSSSTIIL